MALSELEISALPYWTNTFGARGLKEIFKFLFFLLSFSWVRVGPRPTEPLKNQQEKEIKKLFWNQLDGASINLQ